MKIKNALLSALLVVALISCEKERQIPKVVFKAKLESSVCGYSFVEVLDKEYMGLGIKWKSPDGTEYEHVFTVNNPCDFNKAGVKAGEVFNAQIIYEPKDGSCAICLALVAAPPLNRNIEVK